MGLLFEKCLPKEGRLMPPGRSRVLSADAAKKKRRSLPSGRFGAHLFGRLFYGMENFAIMAVIKALFHS
ncbi:hypothetical protein GCWU000341_00128 [Oribacterium sp. oral taxon 078 str. F0262]|nr:hypothetical protein GCWU000341_00128 [Oribacterium sp. oral taxon 078 str. F0262]